MKIVNECCNSSRLFMYKVTRENNIVLYSTGSWKKTASYKYVTLTRVDFKYLINIYEHAVSRFGSSQLHFVFITAWMLDWTVENRAFFSRTVLFVWKPACCVATTVASELTLRDAERKKVRKRMRECEGFDDPLSLCRESHGWISAMTWVRECVSESVRARNILVFRPPENVMKNIIIPRSCRPPTFTNAS